MKFKFVGPGPAEVFGLKWVEGVTHDVTDAHAIAKLKNHPHFVCEGEPVAPKSNEPAPTVVALKPKAKKAQKANE